LFRLFLIMIYFHNRDKIEIEELSPQFKQLPDNTLFSRNFSTLVFKEKWRKLIIFAMNDFRTRLSQSIRSDYGVFQRLHCLGMPT
ncbi:MAG: hypothetical protein LUC93_06815, partial [Planctomycetaceae bacterium]|nr:hypothetical protein [Planctomycetaceae bacterium]